MQKTQGKTPQTRISKAEAARQLGVTSRTLDAMLQRRELAHYRIGGRVKLAQGDVDTYLAGARVEALTGVVEVATA